MKKEKTSLKKNDKVKVVTGKDKGKIGKVIRIIQKKDRVLVENINIVKRHTKPNAQNRQGGILEREAPIHMSNIMLMCNKCMAPIRVKVKAMENGKKLRVCRKCAELIDA